MQKKSETVPTSTAFFVYEGMVHQLDDHQLLEQHVRGDPAAFAKLVGSYRTSIRAYFLRCGFDAATCEDLLQEAFTKIHKGAAAYRPDKPLRAWVFTIAANTARSHLRRKHPSPGLEQELAATGPSVQQLAEARDVLQCLEQAMSTLPLAQREVLFLCCFQELSQAETAEALEMPVNTVKTLLRRGRFALAKALARYRQRAQRETTR